MSDDVQKVLLVDPDARARAFLARQLSSLGFTILEASDGAAAMQIVHADDVRLVVTELYLRAGEDDCLIHAIRGDKQLRQTRTLAHTHRSLPADREWAMRAGADAYLIKPTRAERMRYVVGRLTSARAGSASVPTTTSAVMQRRDSLDEALTELEEGRLSNTSCIVFGRTWWESLSPAQQRGYRKRAKTSHVSLRSDSMLSNHFVELRGRSDREPGLSTERPESPYRR